MVTLQVAWLLWSSALWPVAGKSREPKRQTLCCGSISPRMAINAVRGQAKFRFSLFKPSSGFSLFGQRASVPWMKPLCYSVISNTSVLPSLRCQFGPKAFGCFWVTMSLKHGARPEHKRFPHGGTIRPWRQPPPTPLWWRYHPVSARKAFRSRLLSLKKQLQSGNTWWQIGRYLIRSGVVFYLNSIKFSLFCIAHSHKLQICLRGLYNLYT